MRREDEGTEKGRRQNEKGDEEIKGRKREEGHTREGRNPLVFSSPRDGESWRQREGEGDDDDACPRRPRGKALWRSLYEVDLMARGPPCIFSALATSEGSRGRGVKGPRRRTKMRLEFGNMLS